MCGIIGYVGKNEALPIIIDGLKRLEYRGYDSAGIAFLNGDFKLSFKRSVGKIANLEQLFKDKKYTTNIGIGHTRWATHGRPSEPNTHPHTDCTGTLAVAHNGIIENYQELKNKLSKRHKFTSETDTEVLAHLIEDYLNSKLSLKEAVRKACKQVKGTYAIAVLSKNEPDIIIGARKGSPLVVGIGENEIFLASDIPALLNRTRKMILMEDGEIVTISSDNVKITTLEGKKVERPYTAITWDPVTAEKGGYKHFMLKEIFEQPIAIEDTLRGRILEGKEDINLEFINLPENEIRKYEKIYIVACGTAWHAGLIGKFYIEELSGIPAEVDVASEFRYRGSLINNKSLLIAISQSGETADTLAAVREAKSKGAKVISICNVLGSTLTRESDGLLHTQAGPEIGVASTKAFTTQLISLFILALYLGRIKGFLPNKEVKNYIKHLIKIPRKVEEVLENEKKIIECAKKYFKFRDFLYIGRNTTYPIALEGALKLKEISYIHAEGYPAGEMKHGPIALIDENMPVVVIAPDNKTYSKIKSNIQEIKARDGMIISLVTEGNKEISKMSDFTMFLPDTIDVLTPVLYAIPLQLLAYHIAIRRGCDVDQPRNLAKSVTVE